MLKYFKEELQAKERCFAVVVNQSSSSRKATEMSTTSSFQVNTKNSCVYCKLPHPPSKCTKVTSVSARRNILRKSARCYICLQVGHLSRSCGSDYKCNRCLKRHHISLCDFDASREDKSNENRDRKPKDINNEFRNKSHVDGSHNTFHGDSKQDKSQSIETKGLFTENKNRVLLQTAVCQVANVGENKSLLSRLLLDSGSQRTYITNSLRQRLNLPTLRTEKIIIQTFNGGIAESRDADIVQLRVCSRKKSNLNIYVEAICVPQICSPLRNQNIEFAVKEYDHLKNLDLAEIVDYTDSMEVDILVGLDFYFSFVSGNIIRGSHGPVAVQTNLGWVLSGSYQKDNESDEFSTQLFTTHLFNLNLLSEDKHETLTNVMNKFWNIDNLGVQNEVDVLKKFENELTFNGKRYVVKLPLKPHRDQLPDNYSLAMRRLKILLSKLYKQPTLASEYNKIVNQYIEDGIVEYVPSENTGEINEVHYLPHRAVVRENRETSKVRIVYDASARLPNEPSLNDC